MAHNPRTRPVPSTSSTGSSSSGSSSTARSGHSFANRQDVNDDRLQRRAGDGLTRVRRRDPLDDDRGPGRRAVRVAPALAARPGAMVFVLVGISAHPVWIGLIFSYFFGYKLGWTPITGYCDFINPPRGLRRSRAMGLPHDPALDNVRDPLRGALRAHDPRQRARDMNEDYVRTARAKGAPESVVMRSHILRNAMLPVVTMLGMDIALGLGGAVFTSRSRLARPRQYADPRASTASTSRPRSASPCSRRLRSSSSTCSSTSCTPSSTRGSGSPRWRSSRSRTSRRSFRPTTASSRPSTASASRSRRARRSGSSASRDPARASPA